MAATTNTKVSLKLLIDTKDNRVLFAEAGKEFVDFMFNIMSLPLGTVVRLLTKECMVGCLGNLYGSIEDISDTYIVPTQNKNNLLKPISPNNLSESSLLLLPNIDHSSKNSNAYYICGNNTSYSHCFCISTDPSIVCPNCEHLINVKTTFVAPRIKVGSASTKEGFVKEVVTYMVMDDLVVTPMSTISSITMLNKFNVKEVGALKEEVIEVGMIEGVSLLKYSLQSKTVLTDVFLKKKL